MSHIVFRCRKCGVFLFMSSKNKTKICPRCGKVNNIKKVMKFKSFEAPLLAVQAVAKLNEKYRKTIKWNI